MFFQPNFACGRLCSALLMQRSPSSWLFQLINHKVEFAYWSLLKPIAGRVNRGPEGKPEFIEEVSILDFAAGSSDVHLFLRDLDSLVKEGCTSSYIMSESVLDFNDYLVKVLEPLEGWSGFDRLHLLRLKLLIYVGILLLHSSGTIANHLKKSVNLIYICMLKHHFE